MSNTSAEQLAQAVIDIEQNVNTIEALVAKAFTDADFAFVDQFRDNRGATLAESGAIMNVLVKRMQGTLNTLGNVLYIREKESIKTPVGWRELADTGRRVEAIRILIEFASSPAFVLSDARDVVDAYLKYKF